jgi:hypothetical protein
VEGVCERAVRNESQQNVFTMSGLSMEGVQGDLIALQILYTKTVFKGLAMSDTDWVRRCEDRLHEQWPRASREDLEETARELHAHDHWRNQRAEEAAVTWLRLGVLVH